MDIELIDDGSVIKFVPRSDAGRAFLRNEVAGRRRQWHGDVFCVNRPLAAGLAAAAVADGLEISGEAVIVGDEKEADDQ